MQDCQQQSAAENDADVKVCLRKIVWETAVLSLQQS